MLYVVLMKHTVSIENTRSAKDHEHVFARAVRVPINPQGWTVLGSGPLHAVEVGNSPDLEANILIFHHSAGELNLLVTIDTLFVGPRLKAYLENALAGVIDPDRIVIAASHTHNAPMVDETKPGLGVLDEEYQKSIGEIVALEVSKLIHTEPIQASVRVKSYKTNLVSYRRKRTPYFLVNRRKLQVLPTRLLPNFKQKPSPEAFIVEFLGPLGLMAMIWIMPCHPVSYPNPGEITAHFVGSVRSAERARATEAGDLPFLFLQGASGDLRPPAFSQRPSSLLASLIAPGSSFEYREFSAVEYRNWVDALHAEFSSALEFVPRAPVLGNTSVNISRVQIPQQKYFAQTNSISRNIELNRIVLGGGLQIFAISGEPTHKSQKWLLKGITDSTLIGCTGDAFGYLPSFSQLLAGGYEAQGHRKDFGIQPKWHPVIAMTWLLKDIRMVFRALSGQTRASYMAQIGPGNSTAGN